MKIYSVASTDHSAVKFLQDFFCSEPAKLIKNILGGSLGFTLAEKIENRSVSIKVRELNAHYSIPWSIRRQQSINQLIKILEFSSVKVPYYKDLFFKYKIDPLKISRDIKYYEEVPLLTKDIIREQGARLLSSRLEDVRHHRCKTGGSTGQSCFIYYDQPSADYASAAVIYGRRSIGKSFYKDELHFACRFPEHGSRPWPNKEDFKCFAMNRSNIFFDRIDDLGLENIWQTLNKRRPYLIHGHPSTIYALANYIEKNYTSGKAFSVFESSGELLEGYMRDKIGAVLGCRIVNRYGLAEIGVVAYELKGQENGLQILDSECWLDNEDAGADFKQVVMTSYRNYLMPIIRYASGDLAQVIETDHGRFLKNLIGRIHDVVDIGGIKHATHYVQDILDHRVGGILEFQIDIRRDRPVLRIVLENFVDRQEIIFKLKSIWSDGLDIEFIDQSDLIRVGERAKFRHVVTQ